MLGDLVTVTDFIVRDLVTVPGFASHRGGWLGFCLCRSLIAIIPLVLA